MQKCTEEIFKNDTKEHEIEILKDNGVYRHMRIGKKDSFNMHYYLTTWPGHLCISGDMHDFVFAIPGDTISFFRQETLIINPVYWSGKLVATSTIDGHKEYDPDVFEDVIKRDF